VTIALRQTIGAKDALRTGSYSKTLTFTLSTTTPQTRPHSGRRRTRAAAR